MCPLPVLSFRLYELFVMVRILFRLLCGGRPDDLRRFIPFHADAAGIGRGAQPAPADAVRQEGVDRVLRGLAGTRLRQSEKSHMITPGAYLEKFLLVSADSCLLRRIFRQAGSYSDMAFAMLCHTEGKGGTLRRMH